MSKDFDRLEAYRLYLKDGETPVECIERHRKDIDALLTLLADAKRAAAAERPAPTCATCLRVHEIASRMAERPTLMGCDDINDLVMIVALTEPSLSLPAAPRSVVAPEKE